MPYSTITVYLRFTFESGEKMYSDVHIDIADGNVYKHPQYLEDIINGCVQNVIQQLSKVTKSNFVTEYIDKQEFKKAKKLEKVKLI